METILHLVHLNGFQLSLQKFQIETFQSFSKFTRFFIPKNRRGLPPTSKSPIFPVNLASWSRHVSWQINHSFGLKELAGKRVFFLPENVFKKLFSYPCGDALVQSCEYCNPLCTAQRWIGADLLSPATTPTLDCTANKGCQLCRLLQNADVAALIRRFFLFDAFLVKEPSEMQKN